MWEVTPPQEYYPHLRPSEALVVYRTYNGALCVRHDQAEVAEDGTVVFSGAKPMSAQALGRWAAAWRKKPSRSPLVREGRWVNPRVLYEGPNVTVWWRPPERTRMWFHTAGMESTEGIRVTAPWPGLVFAWNKATLRGVAVATSDRPEQDTPVFRAPFPNVDRWGVVCLGSAASARRWEDAEKAFIESAFSHLLGGDEPLGGCNNYIKLVRFYRTLERRNRKRFPVQKLVPLNRPLKRWIEEMLG